MPTVRRAGLFTMCHVTECLQSDVPDPPPCVTIADPGDVTECLQSDVPDSPPCVTIADPGLPLDNQEPSDVDLSPTELDAPSPPSAIERRWEAEPPQDACDVTVELGKVHAGATALADSLCLDPVALITGIRDPSQEHAEVEENQATTVEQLARHQSSDPPMGVRLNGYPPPWT